MAKLTDTQREWIVDRIACYDTPSQIADAFKDEFGFVITRQQVEEYDPEKRSPAKKWVALHGAIRKRLLDEKAALPISHRNWRLRELEDMARRAKKQKNYKLAAELLEQAAKEQGEYYTNHRNKEPTALTEEERVARMRDAILQMDVQTVGEPTTKPTLTVLAGGASA